MTKTRFLARVSGAEGALNTKALQTWAGRRWIPLGALVGEGFMEEVRPDTLRKENGLRTRCSDSFESEKVVV